MAMMVLDSHVEERLKAEREASGADRYDEVWEGVYMMAPIADTEHLGLQGGLVWALRNVVGTDDSIVVAPGGNVSDREDDWTHNYRIPDVIVVLPGSAAKDCGTHWCGGPDFCVEILSPGDRSRKKLDFYASIGVRELMLIDRDPWTIEFYQLRDGRLDPVGQLETAEPKRFKSDVLPVSFELIPGTPRPRIVVRGRDESQSWTA